MAISYSHVKLLSTLNFYYISSVFAYAPNKPKFNLGVHRHFTTHNKYHFSSDLQQNYNKPTDKIS